MSRKGKTGPGRSPSPDFPTLGDHDYPRAPRLAVAQGEEVGERHEHQVRGFQAAAESAMAEKGISDGLRAGIIEGARTRFGWTVAEVEEWLASRNTP